MNPAGEIIIRRRPPPPAQRTQIPAKSPLRLEEAEFKVRDRLRKEERRQAAADASRAGYYAAR